MPLNYHQIVLGVDRLVPDAQYSRAFSYAELAATWTDERPIPTEAQIQAAWQAVEASQVQLEARRTLEVEGGIGALIASLENEDYDRDLEPAKVRLALALLTKRLIDPTPIVVTAEQLAALENGIVRLFAHLNPS